ncbi:acyl-CoA carboxylase epsilon subunit [Nakamurella sp. GG22]
MSERRTADVIRERNDHDAATVLAIVLALAAQDVTEATEASGHRTIWSDPAYRLRTPQPSPTGWWASAMPR